ncbi:MAG: DUF3789 domain-containing protein [Clostridia bacterium]|nr:DUF3789 domain-containing protein [Clostridia bacterium]MBR4799977.1 DUF3789 domain-containing protein [Clostridia bacterium]
MWTFIIGAMVGAFLGIVLMCLLQVNRER